MIEASLKRIESLKVELGDLDKELTSAQSLFFTINTERKAVKKLIRDEKISICASNGGHEICVPRPYSDNDSFGIPNKSGLIRCRLCPLEIRFDAEEKNVVL